MPKIFSLGSAINSRHFLQLKNSPHTHSGTHQLSVVWSFKACRIVHWDPCFLLGLILKKTRPQERFLQWPETGLPKSRHFSFYTLLSRIPSYGETTLNAPEGKGTEKCLQKQRRREEGDAVPETGRALLPARLSTNTSTRDGPGERKLSQASNNWDGVPGSVPQLCGS